MRPSRVTREPFLLDEWLPAKRATLKPSTAASYEQMISRTWFPTSARLELGKVDGATLNALYAVLLATAARRLGRRGGLSPKSVRNVDGMLHRAFADAVRWRRIVATRATRPTSRGERPEIGRGPRPSRPSRGDGR